MVNRTRDEQLYQDIGIQIEKFRVKHGLTQSQLANQCGLTRTSIVHIERGRQKLPIDRLYSIAEALQISVHDLLPKFRPALKIDPISSNTISETAKQQVEQLLKKYKG